MAADHDIMRGSNAWERISNGIPREVTDETLRDMFHDYAAMFTVLVDAMNRSLDTQNAAKTELIVALAAAKAAVDAATVVSDGEHNRIHDRIDKAEVERTVLKDRLFDPEKGLFTVMADKAKAYTDEKTGKLTALGTLIVGGVVVGCVMLVIQLSGGGLK